MALPTAFSNNTTPTGPQLDGNFSAIGAITQIPCTIAGTNTLTLTPIANVPTVPQYNSTQIYCGAAAQSNTGAVTVAVDSQPTLNVYKDTIVGPVALTGGEIGKGNMVFFSYDAALNSGAGGFHLVTPQFATRVAATLSFGALAPGANSDQSITIAGISIGDVGGIGYPSSPLAGIGYLAFVASSSVVTVRAYNYTPASTLTPTGGLYRVLIWNAF